jgi:excisionase family DNA binding protein
MHPRAGKRKQPHTKHTPVGPKNASQAKKDLGNPHPAVARKAPASVRDSTGNSPGRLVPAPAVPPAEHSARLSDVSQERTLTVKEAAFRLRKSPDAIYLWLRTGRLRGWQPGGRCCSIMVLESSVEQALLCLAGNG